MTTQLTSGGKRAVCLLCAVAVTAAFFVVNEQLYEWLVPPVSDRTFRIITTIAAALVLLATGGRVALPEPAQPWPREPWGEAAGRTASWLLLVGAAAVVPVIVAELWWPDLPGSGDVDWAPFFQSVVRAPLWEEVIWRGLVLGILLRLIPVRGAIALSTVAFALIHWEQGYRGPGLLGTGVVGVVTAVAAWRTGKLWLPIAVHALWNLADGAGILVIVAVWLIWFLRHVMANPRWPRQLARAWASAIISRTPPARRPPDGSPPAPP